MSTRGLLGFVANDEVRAKYMHFDSYPGGWFESDVLPWVAEVTQNKTKELSASRAVSDLRPVASTEEVPGDEYESDPAKILAGGVIFDESAFASDSLFCEWGYIINFDDRVIEVYRGFQSEPHSDGRFASWIHNPSYRTVLYYPIRLMETIPFDGVGDLDVHELHRRVAPEHFEDEEAGVIDLGSLPSAD